MARPVTRLPIRLLTARLRRARLLTARLLTALRWTVLARVGVAFATVAVLAVPTVAYLYVRHEVQVGVQYDAVDPGPLAPEQQTTYLAYASGTAATDRGADLVVLGYHDIVDGELPAPQSGTRRLSVHVTAFAAQLRMLKLAGFQSVSAQQVDDYISRGKPLPRRAVLITFDGARSRLWSYADPILARYGFQAVVFVDPPFVGSAKGTALTWPTLRAMAGNGRWSIGVAAPNTQVTTGPDGATASALVAHRWIAGQHRPETTGEFTARVQASIGRSVHKISASGLPAPRLLSLPFQPGYPFDRVKSAFAELVAAAGTRFPASVLTTAADDAVDRTWSEKRVLPRIEVYGATTDRLLFARIRTASGT